MTALRSGAVAVGLANSALGAQVPVALLSGGLGEDCLLIRAGQEMEVCLAPRLLYSGDELVKASGVSRLRIQWFAPPATHGVRKGRTRLRVAFQAPKGASALLPLAQRAFPAASRAAQEALMELRSPGAGKPRLWAPGAGRAIAMLPGRKVAIPAMDSACRFVVRNEKGLVLLECAMDGQSLEVSPESLGLQSGVSVTWSMEGAQSLQGRMHLLAPSMACRIERDLQRLQPEENPERAAFYLQMVAEAFPEIGDLGWLSTPMLSGSTLPVSDALRDAPRPPVP